MSEFPRVLDDYPEDEGPEGQDDQRLDEREARPLFPESGSWFEQVPDENDAAVKAETLRDMYVQPEAHDPQRASLPRRMLGRMATRRIIAARKTAQKRQASHEEQGRRHAVEDAATAAYDTNDRIWAERQNAVERAQRALVRAHLYVLLDSLFGRSR